jgi:hypothetical protein
MEQASWGGEFSDWNRMLYESSPFNRRPDTHTHTHTRDSQSLSFDGNAQVPETKIHTSCMSQNRDMHTVGA